MRRFLPALILLAAAGAAQAQELGNIAPYSFFDSRLTTIEATERLVLDPLQPIPIPRPEFGVHGGFMKMADADDASMIGGVQLCIPLAPVFSLEASLSFVSADFADGDAEVTQMPVMITGKFHFPLQIPNATGIILAGVGLYSTDVSYSGALAAFSDETATAFGFHIGGGIKVGLAGYNLEVAIKYVFQAPNTDNLDDEEFDVMMLTVGLTFQI